MGSQPSLLRLAVTAFALSSLALLLPGAARADTPDYLYQTLTSSKDPLTVMAGSATAVLTSESGTAGDTLERYALDGAPTQVIAQPGSPMPDGGNWPAGVRFTRAAMNDKVVLFRAFVNGAGTTWGDASSWAAATALYDLTTHRSTWLQSFLVVPQVTKDQLDHAMDMSGPNSIRTTAAADGSKTWLRWLDVSTGSTAIVAGTGDPIQSALGQEAIAAFGPIRITPQNTVIAAVHTSQGHELLSSYEQVAGGAWRPMATYPLPGGARVNQIALWANDPALALIAAQQASGNQLFSLRLHAANSPAQPVPLNGWVVGAGTEFRITDVDRQGHFFAGFRDTQTVGAATMTTDSWLAAVAQPVFTAGQATPNGPATQVGSGSLVLAGSGYPAFTVNAGGANFVVGAVGVPAPRGPMAMASASAVSYTGGGMTYPAWPFSGPGVAGITPPVPQPDGAWLWTGYLYSFPQGYKEPDGTPWFLEWATAGPGAAQFTIPANRFGPLPAMIKVNVGPTVGQSSLPVANLGGTGSLDLLSGKTKFNQLGPVASNLFTSGDQALWHDLGVQLPIGPLYDDDDLDMPVLPPKLPGAGVKPEIARWIPLHDLHLVVTQARVWLYDGNDKLIGAKPNPKLERDAQGNVSGVRLAEPNISAGQAAILRLEFEGVDVSVAHAADGSLVDLSTSNRTGSQVGRQDPVNDLTDPNLPERLGDPRLGDLVRALRDPASPNQGLLITQRINPFFTRGVLLWNVEALRGKEAQLTLIADCSEKRDHKSIQVSVSGPPKN